MLDLHHADATGSLNVFSNATPLTYELQTHVQRQRYTNTYAYHTTQLKHNHLGPSTACISTNWAGESILQLKSSTIRVAAEIMPTK